MANLQDLEMELWLRRRNDGELTWRTKNGDILPIKDLTDEHLINIIKMLRTIRDTEEIMDVIDDARLC